jgi:chemotaxis protein histidine kinase CheA
LETHLPALNEGLLALEKGPVQPERLEALMRAAHSVKGAAKIVGAEAAVQVAHALEDCFVAAQNGAVTLTSDAVDVLLRGVDALHRVTNPADDGGLPEPALQQLLADIAAVRAGRAAPAAVSPPAAPVAADEPPTIRPAGNLDAVEAEAVRLRLLQLLRDGAGEIRLDLAEVRDVEPAGLLLLALAARHRLGLAFTVVNASPAVQTLLRRLRLDGSFAAVEAGT